MGMNYEYIKNIPSNKHLYISKEGLDSLKNKLDNLRKERFHICRKLREMDPKEKVEYISSDDVIKTLEVNEENILNISDVLRNISLIEEDNNANNVQIGSVVDLRLGNKTLKYRLVGTIEANPFDNKISEESPLGQALLGHKKSEVVQIVTPRGKELQYKILSIA